MNLTFAVNVIPNRPNLPVTCAISQSSSSKKFSLRPNKTLPSFALYKLNFSLNFYAQMIAGGRAMEEKEDCVVDSSFHLSRF